MKRNLLFFVYPLRGSCWQWHIDRLTQYRDVWNGKRLMVIAFDARTEDPVVVRQAAAALDCEFREVPNDDLGEVNHFHQALSEFESVDDNEALFYAHAKGVTRTEFLDNILAWCEGMYYLNLSSPALIDRLLMDHLAVGAFINRRVHGGSSWHYSGSFYWLRHDAIFTAPWKDKHDDRFDVEGFPGRIVTSTMAFSLSGEWPHDLYAQRLNMDYCRQWMEEMNGGIGGIQFPS